jgi:WhiB family redox-sensing transcriptional regulator
MSAEWVDGALCAQTDPESFFPAKGSNAAAAKSTCKACPVRAECLEAAMADPTLDGVWGGTTPMERRALRMAAA